MSTPYHDQLHIQRVGIAADFSRMIVDAIRNDLPMFVASEEDRQTYLRWGFSPNRVILLRTPEQLALWVEMLAETTEDARRAEIIGILDPKPFYGPFLPEP